jgi:hypothetical protein
MVQVLFQGMLPLLFVLARWLPLTIKMILQIVGIKYLFITLARFIVELDKISESSMKAKQGGSGQTTRSLLSMEMEVDPDKYGDNAFTDSEANVYQLILTCQKIFTAIRSTVKEMCAMVLSLVLVLSFWSDVVCSFDCAQAKRVQAIVPGASTSCGG